LEVLLLFFAFLICVGVAIAYVETINDETDINYEYCQKLEKEIEGLKIEIEEQKPKELYRVEVERYVDGDLRTTLIPCVTEIKNDDYSIGFTYYRGDNTIFVKGDGEFIIPTDTIVSIDKTKLK